MEGDGSVAVGRGARLSVTSHLAPRPPLPTRSLRYWILHGYRYISYTVTLDYLHRDWLNSWRHITLHSKLLSFNRYLIQLITKLFMNILCISYESTYVKINQHKHRSSNWFELVFTGKKYVTFSSASLTILNYIGVLRALDKLRDNSSDLRILLIKRQTLEFTTVHH